MQAVEDTLRLLPPERRKIVKQRFFHGWTMRKIAQKQYLSTQTVARYLDGAIELLGRLLGL
ncbi:MAG: sigma-70 family RNA polymerase sigma factor [Dethiobacter sp.]|nr:sigma-70 family RNA polymerase sigma factor [Dethiobacter sp.]